MGASILGKKYRKIFSFYFLVFTSTPLADPRKSKASMMTSTLGRTAFLTTLVFALSSSAALAEEGENWWSPLVTEERDLDREGKGLSRARKDRGPRGSS